LDIVDLRHGNGDEAAVRQDSEPPDLLGVRHEHEVERVFSHDSRDVLDTQFDLTEGRMLGYQVDTRGDVLEY
jgi:hypothetical protein